MPVEERRRQLLDIATRLVVAHGAANLPTRAIAAEAGVSGGLIYHLSGSKEAMFREAVLRPLEGLVTRVAELCARRPALDDRRRAGVGVQVHTEILGCMPEVTPPLGAALHSDQRGVPDSFRSDLLELLTRAEDAGRRAGARGVLPRAPARLGSGRQLSRRMSLATASPSP